MFGRMKFEIFIDETDVMRVWSKIIAIVGESRKISVGYCGWASEPSCWWIRLRLKHSEKVEIVEWLKEQKDVKIYNRPLIV